MNDTSRSVNIPAIALHKSHNRVFRFQFTDDVAGYVTNPHDLCLLGAFGVTQLIGGTYLYPYAGAFRFRRLEMWSAISPGLTSSATCVFTMTRTTTSAVSAYLSPQVQDVTINPNVPAHLVVTPRTAGAQLLRDWFAYSDTDPLFQISGPKGTILEVELELMPNFQPGLPSGAGSLTTVSHPTLGWSAFDLQNSSGSRVMIPLSAPGVVVWD